MCGIVSKLQRTNLPQGGLELHSIWLMGNPGIGGVELEQSLHGAGGAGF